MAGAQNLIEDKHRPSFQLDNYMSGKLPEEKASKEVLSMATLPIYKMALPIARLPTLERRRLAFAEVPEHLSARVGEEIKRIFKDEGRGK
ncbi:MAG: hypothetical protein COA78_06890 [Blastopirellula sp.]|nr:MAG: hypothetical protein COA78_06890 [Blastopirellula sp.]